MLTLAVGLPNPRFSAKAGRSCGVQELNNNNHNEVRFRNKLLIHTTQRKYRQNLLLSRLSSRGGSFIVPESNIHFF
jgi:hypothetical protein